jgi:uncharacterized membrane protein
VARARKQPSKNFDRVFSISLVLKGIDAVLEIVGGLVFVFVAPDDITSVVRWAISHDLAGDPHDWIARHILHATNGLSRSTSVFAAVYLLTHGIAKLALVVLVLRGKLWAYPWMIGLLLAFIVYQAYRFTTDPGAGLVILSVFDAFVAWLTWVEYRARRPAKHKPSRRHATATAASHAGRPT